MARTTRLRGALSLLGDVLRVHLRTIPATALAVGVGIVAVGALLYGYAAIVGASYPSLNAALTDPDSTTRTLILLMVPIALLGLLAALVWTGIVTQAASAAIGRRDVRLTSGVVLTLRRTPRVLLVGFLALMAVILAVALSPLFVVAGILGLLATPLLARSRFAEGRPRVRALVLIAIPLGVAAWLFVRTALATTSVWLSGSGIRAAFRDAAERSRGREVALGLSILAAAALTLGATQGIVLLVGLLGLGPNFDLLAQVVALVVVGPLLFVVLAVFYRRAGAVPPATVAVPRRAAWRARTAVALVMALLIPVSVTVAPAPAQAIGSTAVAFHIEADPTGTVPTDSPTSLSFFVGNAESAEVIQPTGPLRIWIDGVELSGPFTFPGGMVPVEIEQTFTAGPHRIDATYGGDDTYASATAFLDLTAADEEGDPLATEISEFTLTPTSPPATPAGGTVTATVRVSVPASAVVPTGSVSMSFYGEGDPFDTQPLVAGVATFTMVLPPGANDLVARYLPTAGFVASSLDATHYVGASPSTTTIEADTGTSSVGQSVKLTARVTATYGPTATGTVNFAAHPESGPAIDLGPATLTAGVAVLDTTDLPLGVVDLVASYVGTATVAPSESSPLEHTVTGASVSVVVNSDTPAPVHGDTIILTVTVFPVAPATGTPTGEVAILIDGAEVASGSLSGGEAHLAVPAGAAGSRTYVAEYTGAGSFADGSGSTTLTVAQRPTTAYVTGDPDGEYTYGESQTYLGYVDATGGDSTPTGTVELWIGGDWVADGILNSMGAFTITSTRAPVQTTSLTVAYVKYLGDADHLPSEVLPEDGVSVELSKASVAPVLTADPEVPVVGEQAELIATIPDLGDGATGWVTFSSLGVPVAPAVAVGADGTARLTVTITQPTTRYVAEYTGDSNFEARDSDVLVVTAGQTPAAVTLTASDPFVLGDLVDLVATVDIGIFTPAKQVQFRTPDFILGHAAVVGGEARLQVCVGFAADCPAGVPVLGRDEVDLTAIYPEDDSNAEGTSAPLPFTVLPAPTTVDLLVSNTDVKPGDHIFLTATVEGVNTRLEPDGYVVFYGVDGDARQTLGTEYLVDGVATLENVLVGAGPDDLRWPTDHLRAEYFPGTHPFAGSADDVDITYTRLAVAFSPPLLNPTAFALTPITVTLLSAAGLDADFTGAVDITTDQGETCRAFVGAGAETATCSVKWTTAGAHSFSATYAGDPIHAATTDPVDHPVTVGSGVSDLHATSTPSGTAAVGQDVTVQWVLPGAGATGTVTVWGDGSEWCHDVPVTDLSCVGSFGSASATGSDVTIVVRYSGDATWAGSEHELSIRVTSCAVLDVRSNSALGTVTVDTAPNCGEGGYAIGTSVTVTAHPQPGGEFLAWLAYADPEAPGLVPVATTAATQFTVGAGSESWVHVASFGVPCHPITANATGSGGIFVYPLSNCSTPDDKPGWLYGTDVSIYPDPAVNPRYGEPDVFRLFGEVVGGGVSNDTVGKTRMRLTVTGPTVVPIIFSPLCHPVSVVFAPAATGDTSRLLTPQNCTSLSGNGYYRGTLVEVEATPGDPHHAITSWTIDGVTRSDLGTQNTATFTIGAANPVVARVDLVTCYTLDVQVDGVIIPNVGPVGQVARSLEPNCPDGSDRYLAGSVVTLTPEILYDGVSFSSWDADPRSGYVPDEGPTGLVPSAARTLTMSADVTATAGFYYAPACSSITVLGDTKTVSITSAIAQAGISESGCGNGYYFDELKMYSDLMDLPPTDPGLRKYRSVLDFTITPQGPLPVYLSVRGDLGGDSQYNCSNQVSTGAQWTPFGAFRGTVRCLATGPISVLAQSCQPVVSNAQIHVAGEPASVRHSYAVPSTIFSLDDKGNVFGTDYSGYQFTEAVAIKRELIDEDADGVEDVVDYTQTIDTSKYNYTFTDTQSGSCAINDTFPPDTDIAIFASQPPGFSFTGWAEPLNPAWPFLQPNVRRTTSTAPAVVVTPLYEVECFTVTLGEGVTLRGDAPHCPGTPLDENKYIAGTVLQVQAENYLNGRFVNKFKTGVLAGQVWEDPDTQDIVGYVLVTQDHNVTADYPSTAERVGRGIAQGFKLVAGVLAVAGPIVLGTLVPPAGILFAVLGAGAGIASLAGQDEIASAFDLINPTSIITCAARWAFSNTGQASGGGNFGAIGGTGWKLVSLLRGKDLLAVSLTSTTMATGGAAFVAGLVQSGILSAPLKDWQTVEELAGTDTMTGCLDDKWRLAGSNLTG